jgi:hypothetical protein
MKGEGGWAPWSGGFQRRGAENAEKGRAGRLACPAGSTNLRARSIRRFTKVCGCGLPTRRRLPACPTERRSRYQTCVQTRRLAPRDRSMLAPPIRVGRRGFVLRMLRRPAAPAMHGGRPQPRKARQGVRVSLSQRRQDAKESRKEIRQAGWGAPETGDARGTGGPEGTPACRTGWGGRA